MSAVQALNAVAERSADKLEAAVLEGMLEMKAFVVGSVMAIPVVIVDGLGPVNLAIIMAFHFRLGVGIIAPWRRRRDVSLVGARRVGFPVLPFLAAHEATFDPGALLECRDQITPRLRADLHMKRAWRSSVFVGMMNFRLLCAGRGLARHLLLRFLLPCKERAVNLELSPHTKNKPKSHGKAATQAS